MNACPVKTPPVAEIETMLPGGAWPGSVRRLMARRSADQAVGLRAGLHRRSGRPQA
jgi:hypothetical protein